MKKEFAKFIDNLRIQLILEKSKSAVYFIGKRPRVKTARVLICNVIEDLFALIFTKMKMSKPLTQYVGKAESLADIVAENFSTKNEKYDTASLHKAEVRRVKDIDEKSIQKQCNVLGHKNKILLSTIKAKESEINMLKQLDEEWAKKDYKDKTNTAEETKADDNHRTLAETGNDKIHISLVIINCIATAKSTTIDHLIYKCRGTNKHAIEKFKKEASGLEAPFKYAWISDNLKAETCYILAHDVKEKVFCPYFLQPLVLEGMFISEFKISCYKEIEKKEIIVTAKTGHVSKFDEEFHGPPINLFKDTTDRSKTPTLLPVIKSQIL